MAKLIARPAQEAGVPPRIELRGEKLGLVSVDPERKRPLGGRVLLVIVCVSASSILVVSLPNLLSVLFGLFLDLLLHAAG